MTNPLRLFVDLQVLFARFGIAWSKRATVLAILVFLGALAEMMVIGTIVPFIAIIANPEGTQGSGFARDVLQYVPQIPGYGMVTTISVLFILMASLAAIVRLVLAWTTYLFVFGIGHELSVEVYSRLIDQPYAYHISTNSSEAITAANWSVDVTHNTILPIVQSLSACVIAAFIITAIFLVDPKVAGITIASFALIYALPTYFGRHRLLVNGQILRDLAGERVRAIHEGMGGIRDILIDQAQPIYTARFGKVDRTMERRMRENVFMAAAPRFVIESLGMILIAVLALYLSGRPGGVSTALPILGALAIGAQRMMPLLQMIYQSWAQILGMQGKFQALLEIGRLPRLTGPAIEHLPFRHAIELKNLSFTYNNGLRVLDNISFRIDKGAKVAFIGQTGSGKSTLIDIIMGLLEPASGTVRIDGSEMNEERRRGWQRNIAHVSQSIYLSDSTLAENIAFGVAREQIDMARVEEAARSAALTEFVASLPRGFATEVGERGIRLSGGQRQRIGIARALYKRAPVLILDEATSALDIETEAAVMANLHALDERLTVLIIAHRLSTIKPCDTIYRLDKGRIVDVGTFEEVIEVANGNGSSVQV